MIMPRNAPGAPNLLDGVIETARELGRAVLPPWLYSTFVGAVSPLVLLYLYYCVLDAALYGGKWSILYCPDGSKIHFQATGFPLVFFHVAMVGFWTTGIFLSSKMTEKTEEWRDYAALGLLEYSVAVLLFLLPVFSAGIALALPFGDISGKVTMVFGGGADIRLCTCAFRRILPVSLMSPLVSFVLGALSLVAKPSIKAVLMLAVSVVVFAFISGLIAWVSR